MSRMNKYYNSPTELIARAIEMYIFNRETVYQKAPKVFLEIENRDKRFGRFLGIEARPLQMAKIKFQKAK